MTGHLKIIQEIKYTVEVKGAQLIVIVEDNLRKYVIFNMPLEICTKILLRLIY